MIVSLRHKASPGSKIILIQESVRFIPSFGMVYKSEWRLSRAYSYELVDRDSLYYSEEKGRICDLECISRSKFEVRQSVNKVMLTLLWNKKKKCAPCELHVRYCELLGIITDVGHRKRPGYFVL